MQKTILLAIVVLLAGTWTATAQTPTTQLTCQLMMGVTTSVRAEGLADLIGDLTLSCFVNDPAPLDALLDVRVTLNTNVTNNRDFGRGTDVTDALLFNTQFACPPCTPPVPSAPVYGRLLSNNTLQWITPVTVVPSMNGQTLLQISNIRAKAFGITGAPMSPPAITASATIAALGTALPVFVVPSGPVTAGFVQTGLGVSLQGGVESFRVRLQELMPTAFKPLGYPLPGPSATSNQEDGAATPESGVNGGGATQGTRFLLRFTDMPGGVQFLVPHVVQAAAGGLEIRRVFNADADGAGGCYYMGCLTPPPTGTMASIDIAKSTGYAVYEVVNSNPYSLDPVEIPVVACRGRVEDGYCHNVVSPSTLRTLAVRTSLAPVSTRDVSDPAAPEPRFVELGIPLRVPR